MASSPPSPLAPPASSPPPSIIEILPAEILIYILSFIVHPSSQLSLDILLTCQSFHKLAAKFLYETVNITSFHGTKSFARLLKSSSEDHGRKRKLLGYTKTIHLEVGHYHLAPDLSLSSTTSPPLNTLFPNLQLIKIFNQSRTRPDQSAQEVIHYLSSLTPRWVCWYSIATVDWQYAFPAGIPALLCSTERVMIDLEDWFNIMQAYYHHMDQKDEHITLPSIKHLTIVVSDNFESLFGGVEEHCWGLFQPLAQRGRLEKLTVLAKEDVCRRLKGLETPEGWDIEVELEIQKGGLDYKNEGEMYEFFRATSDGLLLEDEL